MDAAMVKIIDKITDNIQKYGNTLCLAVDITKAFDTADHRQLSQRLLEVNLEESIHNWIVSFISDRMHVTHWEGITSVPVKFNSGIVQGSAIRPVLFLFCISNLKPATGYANFFKYADDNFILFQSINQSVINCEWESIKNWAMSNNLSINLNKTKAILFDTKCKRCSSGAISEVILDDQRIKVQLMINVLGI